MISGELDAASVKGVLMKSLPVGAAYSSSGSPFLTADLVAVGGVWPDNMVRLG